MLAARERQRHLYALASGQEGVVGRAQLVASGISTSTIQSWSRSGRLIPAFEGVYSLGRPIDSIGGWWMAATLAAGEGAALAGFSAAQAIGFGSPCRIVEVVRPRGRSRLLVPRIRPGPTAEVRKTVLPPGDVTTVRGIPTMTTARALLDIAGRSTPPRLRRVFIEAGRHGHLTGVVLRECRERGAGFRHRARLVRLAEAWSSGSGRIRSYLEGDFRIFCFERGIPPPISNATIEGLEVDAFWPEHRVVVELDSRQFHGDAIAFEQDRSKSNRLTAMGYVVLRITWTMLGEGPAEVEKLIRRTLGCN